LFRKARGSRYFTLSGYPIAAFKVKIAAGGRVTHPHDLTELEHYHDFRELVIVVRGVAQQRLQGIACPVAAGDVYILQEKSRHHFFDIEELELINVMYDMARLPLPFDQLRQMPGYSALFLLEPQYRKRHQFSSRLKLGPVEVETARGIGEAMVRETQSGQAGRGALLLSHLLELMTFLSRQYGMTRTAGGRELLRIGDVIGSLEREFTRPWTLAGMCAMAHMSRSTFIRTFRKALGTSPMEFLLEKRVSGAERLLRETDRQITEIALETGFSDSNYFARQFRRRRGLTPSEYRKGRGRSTQHTEAEQIVR
jgi:AraC-like DNA-binding protein